MNNRDRYPMDREPNRRGLVIEPMGAYIAELTDTQGRRIFLQKQTVTIDGKQKLRGGCHPCWPNFGPGGESGLPQHGVARTSEWKQEVENGAGVLTLDGSAMPGYEGVRAEIVYVYDDKSLVSTMTTRNDSNHEVRVAPAFHPYFDAPAGAEITLDGVPINLADYHEAQSIDGAEHTLIIDGLRYTPHPTHMNWDEALLVQERLQPRATWLTHMTCEIKHARDEATLPPGVRLAYDGLKLHW